jgi:hypothetical protein
MEGADAITPSYRRYLGIGGRMAGTAGNHLMMD